MATFGVMWKVVVLLVVMQVAASITAAAVEGQLRKGGPGGRFMVADSEEYGAGVQTVGQRHLLNLNLCGRGSPPDYECPSKLRGARTPKCCPFGIFGSSSRCVDVGSDEEDNCGGCNVKCGFGLDCCFGKCSNKEYDRNNCGKCGRACPPNVPCRRGNCGY